ncbi:hypothetical protein DSLPV1_109 [Dishui lake phycodnavirus 1]|uniref:hypothetical protein n=1 Tax=Dishui lake phycodnavirus 1 TaxID=2079134 RepID=UPI000CD6A9D3|nr:hypothetical protein C5Y57_gp109 [Dishui lake phycodnavirus 1]AUT19080.1 hypothetical protein DSLPV1_109 [Dishui lake phycodnavirus 1]
MTDTSELSNNVQKLVELSKQIAEARKDMKVLIAAEKKLKEQVKSSMITQDIDTINLKKGKISVKKSVRKQSMTKTNIVDGLRKFFNGDEDTLQKCLAVINENLPVKESTSLTLSGIKESTSD